MEIILRLATANNKKQISVSQHSSISQADDCSSPYARVRSPSHAYDKVRPAEHPYAQLKGTDSSGNRSITTPNTSNVISETNGVNGETLSRHGSQQSLLDSIDGRQPVIPAASAIAGRVSASQELPYMTPPIVQSQQFFSGDSQDSSSMNSFYHFSSSFDVNLLYQLNLNFVYRGIHKHQCT